MNKILVILFGSLFLLSSTQVFAEEIAGCEPVKGDEKTCEQSSDFTIDKMVENPDSKSYVHNLGAKDPRYKPDQEVSFKITVTSTSDKTIPQVTVTDYFPNYVTYLEGIGNFDQDTGVLTFTVDKLNGKEARVFFVKGKVASADKLPSAEAGCVINQAKATDGKNTSQDNSLFCIQKEVKKEEKKEESKPTPTPTTELKVQPPVEVEKTPETGPGMAGILMLVPVGVAGIIIRRLSR